jgi:hypothetical protein
VDRLRLASCALLVIVGLLGAAAPASAARPTRHTDTITFTSKSPAGQTCDFPLRDTITVTIAVMTLTNASGEAVLEVEHGTGTITHTNLATGYTLTEVGPLNSVRWLDSNTGSTMGIQWHLRDPSGKIVLTVAGRLTYSLDPFEILTITPRVERFLDFAETICPLLGGSPA